jgi:cytoskeletal protein CcmA (bactofilin family)
MGIGYSKGIAMINRPGLLVACLMLAAAAAAQETAVAVGNSTYIGGEVDINDPVEGGLRAAGGRITVSAPVSGSAYLAGGKVTVSGAIKGNLRAAGGHVVIDGPVDGDAAVAAGKLDLGPNARIAGSLHFRGGELARDPAAQVLGTIDNVSGRRHGHEFTPFGRFGRGWIWTAGLMVLAAIIAGALPGPTRRMADELRAHPWHAPLLGFIALTCIPVAAVLVMITVIGIPLGLLALMGYAALLLVGYVWICVVVGGLLLDRYKADAAGVAAWRVGAAVLAMLVLALLARLPIVGGFVAFAALLIGVGMIVAATFRRAPPQATAA